MPQATSFFFYDLETSGIDPRRQRIMQFAGQRTDLQLRPVGEPVNLLVKLTDEVLPEPQAIAITGLTPQRTVREGLTEAELMRYLTAEVFTPGTITTGFNSIRFDDGFVRYLHYRNFYDPYEWAYADGRSRWDLLDVMRMARALRPEGITWPFDDDGRPVNTLVKLSSANQLEHTHAHDAASDVEALIGVARLLRQHQPKFFDYLLSMRSKTEVTKLVNLDAPAPFVYTSGRYPKANHHTTVAYPVAPGKNSTVMVYDLRHDPAVYADLSAEQLTALRTAPFEQRSAPGFTPFPVKTLTPTHCPAVAPLATLTPEAEERIGLTVATAQKHLKALLESSLIKKLTTAAAAPGDFPAVTDVDARLYDGFINGPDKAEMARVRAATEKTLAQLKPHFNDPRLPELFLRYQARNFPDSLSETGQETWNIYRTARLQADFPDFAANLEKAAATASPETISALADLKLWAESIMPPE